MNSSYNLHQNTASPNSSLGFLPNGTLTPNLDWLLKTDEIQRIVNISFILLLAIVSVFGNASLLIIFIKYKGMRTTTNFFIINIVISDLLCVTFAFLPALEHDISESGEWKVVGAFGLITCKLTYFIRDMSYTVSIVTMVAIALDRFYAVVYPIKRRPRYLSLRFCIPVIWLLSTAPFAINLYTARLVTHPIEKDKHYCFMIWTPAFDQVKSPRILYVFVVVSFFIAPLVLITIFYSIIIYKLRNRDIPGVRSSESEKIRRNRNRSTTKVGVLIVLCFFFSWAPYHCLQLIMHFHWKYAPPIHLFKIIYWLFFIFTKMSNTSVASNVFVLYTSSSRFRNCLKKMLKSCCCCCSARSLVNDCSDSGQATQSFYLHGKEVKIEGVINKGMLTEQTIKLESGWETKL